MEIEKTKIIETITHLFKGADEQDWNKIEKTMTEMVVLDYTAMIGGEPANLTPRQITENWKNFLPGFDQTSHNLSDFKVTVHNNSSTTTYYGKADHFIGDKVWTVEGTYETVLVRIDNNWLITKQKFNFIRQLGDTALPAVATERLKTKI